MQGFLETTTCVHILEGSTVPPEPQLDEQETAGRGSYKAFTVFDSREAAVPNRCACAFDVCAATTTTKRRRFGALELTSQRPDIYMCVCARPRLYIEDRTSL